MYETQVGKLLLPKYSTSHQFDKVNPNQARGGWNLPEATLTACRYVLDGVRTVKPSCNFHFWCLKSF